jgi:glutamine amidotransferase
MIGILNLEIGNLRSVSQAVYELGYDISIVNSHKEFNDLTHLIIPGVGHFQTAINNLQQLNLVEAIHDFIALGKPTLGICLGMQLLASLRHEGGAVSGLDLIKGTVSKFEDNYALRVPHVGWNTVSFKRDHPVFKGVKNDRDFYFVHSYHFVCENEVNNYAVTEYGYPFSAIVGEKNLLGFQFHPEKSQKNGLLLLENFCRWDGKC